MFTLIKVEKMSIEKGIFEKVKAYSELNAESKCELMDGILGRFDKESNSYAFYKQNQSQGVDAVVYVTQGYFQSHGDVSALEDEVLNYLNQKKGMQATFKTSGVDELPLIKKESDAW